MAAPPRHLLDPIAADLDSQGIVLDDHQRDRLGSFLLLLETWNRRINLTGTRRRADLLRRHLLDCLMLAALPRPPGALHWLDAGSGAGLPAVVLAVLYPTHTITAVDTVTKKITFQQHAARTLGLNNLHPARGDVFQWVADDRHRERYDILVARAFTGLEPLLSLGRGLLRPGGELWAMKGRRWREEWEAAPPNAASETMPSAAMAAYRLGPRVHAYGAHAKHLKGAEAAGVVLVWRLAGKFVEQDNAGGAP